MSIHKLASLVKIATKKTAAADSTVLINSLNDYAYSNSLFQFRGLAVETMALWGQEAFFNYLDDYAKYLITGIRNQLGLPILPFMEEVNNWSMDEVHRRSMGKKASDLDAQDLTDAQDPLAGEKKAYWDPLADNTKGKKMITRLNEVISRKKHSVTKTADAAIGKVAGAKKKASTEYEYREEPDGGVTLVYNSLQGVNTVFIPQQFVAHHLEAIIDNIENDYLTGIFDHVKLWDPTGASMGFVSNSNLDDIGSEDFNGMLGSKKKTAGWDQTGRKQDAWDFTDNLIGSVNFAIIQLKDGVSEDQIVSALLSGGWPDVHVEDIMRRAREHFDYYSSRGEEVTTLLTAPTSNYWAKNSSKKTAVSVGNTVIIRDYPPEDVYWVESDGSLGDNVSLSDSDSISGKPVTVTDTTDGELVVQLSDGRMVWFPRMDYAEPFEKGAKRKTAEEDMEPEDDDIQFDGSDAFQSGNKIISGGVTFYRVTGNMTRETFPSKKDAEDLAYEMLCDKYGVDDLSDLNAETYKQADGALDGMLEEYDGYQLLSTEACFEQFEGAVKAHMQAESFFPTVWSVSDHGNAFPMVLGKKKTAMFQVEDWVKTLVPLEGVIMGQGESEVPAGTELMVAEMDPFRVEPFTETGFTLTLTTNGQDHYLVQDNEIVGRIEKIQSA